MPRINIIVSEEKLEEIKKLMSESGISTQKDFFENAVTLAKWAMKEKKKGKEVGALDEDDKFTEIVMPMLENVKNHS